MDINRIKKSLAAINAYTTGNYGISRLAYTVEEQLAKKYFLQTCKKLGMETKVDTVGNIIATLKGVDERLPSVAIGSHLDTVYNGGQFDGTLGVVAGLEIIRTFVEEGIRTLHSIELIVFSCEESSRFNISTLGSKAMLGEVDLVSIRNIKDRDNIKLEDAFQMIGLNIEDYRLSERGENEIKVFFELHIEQGKKLISKQKTIGIVTGIAAPLRLSISIEGESAHSGTTGMDMRKDALLAASEFVLLVEKAALEELEFETVATVGVLEVTPGAINVVPGLVNLKVDIRGINIESRNRVLERIKDTIDAIEIKRKVTISIDWLYEEEPVLMDDEISNNIKLLCEKLELSYLLMPSGAGHDSMNMAKRWPTSLIFVPSVNGLSHHPDEYTKDDDLYAGIQVLKAAVETYAIIVNEEGELLWNQDK